MATIEVELCVVCEKRPVTQKRNMGRYPSSTCGAECANMLNVCGSIKVARAKYKAKHIADDAFEKFVYPEESCEHNSN